MNKTERIRKDYFLMIQKLENKNWVLILSIHMYTLKVDSETLALFMRMLLALES